MFSINTAKLGDDNQIDLPLNQTSKRKFTIWFDSTGGKDYAFVDRVSQLPASFSGSFTGAKTYKLPYPLKSRTGFFNISLKSIIIGQNPINSFSWEDITDPLNTTWYYNNYQLLNSGFKINLVGSSAYNGYIRDNGNLQVNNQAYITLAQGDETNIASEYVRQLDLYSLVSGLTPFGNFQIETNANGLSNNIRPNAPAGIVSAADPPVAKGAPTIAIGNNFIPSSYPTKVDDISSTFPDTMFYNNEIGIVLTTIGNLVAGSIGGGADLGQPSVVVRYNLPLLVDASYSATAGNPGTTTFPDLRNNHRVFNLPYSFCLQFEEA